MANRSKDRDDKFDSFLNEMDAKYGRKKETKPSTTPTTSTTISTPGASKEDRDAKRKQNFDSYRAEMDARYNKSAEVNGAYINAYLKDAQSFLTRSSNSLKNISWQSATSDMTSWNNEYDALRGKADKIRTYLRDNKDTLDSSAYKQLTSVLDDIYWNSIEAKLAFRNANQYYSQWETEEDYNFWDDHSTAEKRQAWYAEQQANIDDLNDYLDNYYTIELWYQSYKERPWDHTDKEEVSKKLAQYNKHLAYKQKYGSAEDAKGRIAEIEADMRNYERGNFNERGQFYGSKRADDHYSVSQNADFATTSANRDYTNATREQLWDYDMSVSAGSEALSNGGYFDDAGNIRDSKGNIVQNANAPVIEDKLGMFLKATDEEKTEAYNMLSASNGNYNYTWGDLVQEGDQGSWKYLDETELGIYYTYLGESQEKAYQYLSDMKPELNRRQTLDETGKLHTAYEEANLLEKIAMSAASVPAQFVSNAFGFVEDAGAVLTGNEINPYSAAHSGMHYSQTVRGDTAKELDKTGFKLPVVNFTLGDIYQTGMSRIDSALATSVFGGGGVAFLGMGAAEAEAYRLYQQGASAEQITLDAFAAGVSEAVWEYISFGKLKEIKKVGDPSKWVKSVLIQGWNEALEEGGTELTNLLTNALIMGSQSDLAEMYEENEEKAFWTFVDIVQRELHAMTGGFLSGMGAGGGQATRSYIDTTSQYRETGSTIRKAYGGVDALKKLANEVAGVSDKKMKNTLTKQADKVSDKVSTGIGASIKNAINDTRAGRLLDTVNTANSSANKADIATILEMNRFSSKDAKAIADAVVALANGEQLTAEQAETLKAYKDNDHVKQLFSNFDLDERSIIGKRNRAIAEFEKDVKTGLVVTELRETTEKAFAPTGEYEVSKGNKSIRTDTNEEIDIKGIYEISKGKLILELADGSTIDAKNVSFASESDALIYEAVANLGDNIDAKTAERLIKKYDGSNATVFSRAMAQAYSYGFYGIDKSELTGRLSLATELTEEQRNFAYGLGEQYRGVKDIKDKANARAELADNVKEGKTNAPGEKGLYYRDKDGNTVSMDTYLKNSNVVLKNDAQKTGLEAMRRLSETLGVRINVFESWQENGKTYYLNQFGKKVEGNPNGFYDTLNGEIYIALDAGSDFSGTMLFTISHELTHQMRQWSPEHFTQIAKIVFAQAGFKGDVGAMIALKQKTSANKGKPISYDVAMEEVVADAMETILKDGKVFEFMQELKQKDRTTWQKVKAWFKNLTKFLRKLEVAYGDRTANTMEGRKVAAFAKETREQIERIFAEGAVSAGENYQQAIDGYKAEQNQFSTDNIRGSADGAVVQSEVTTAIVESKMQIRTEYEELPKQIMNLSDGSGKILDFIEGLKATPVKGIAGKAVNGYTSRAVRGYAMGISGFTQAQIAEVNKFMDTMADFMEKAGVTYKFIGLQDVEKAQLHYTYNADGSIKSIVLSAMVKNGDYPVNFDLSSICKKREAMSKLVDKLAKRGSLDSGTVKLTPANIFRINTALKDAGYETACLGCFVESKRYNSLEWATKFCNKWNAAVKKVNPNATYFGYGDASFSEDSFTLEQAIKVDDAANKYIKATKTERLANALAKYKAKEQAGLPLVEGKILKVDGEELNTFSKAARDRLMKSDTISDELKEKYLHCDVSTLNMADVEFLLENGILPGANLSNKQAVTEMVKSGEAYQHLLRPSDLLTDRGISKLEALPNFHGVLYGHYGSGTPKLIQSYTPYNSEIALLPSKKGDLSLAEYLYTIAGVRMQSFSDFQIQNIYDYLQMVGDLAARKVPAHAYTKELPFAKLLGMTGIKVNLSVMFDIDPMVDKAHAGLTKLNKLVHRGEYAKVVWEDEQGKWVYNIGDYQTQKMFAEAFPKEDKRFLQSIGFADAVKIQTSPGYSANCGIIGVGYSDLGIFAMLNDNRIRYIIPYHASSLPAEIKVATNIALGTDYTPYQNNMKIKEIVDRNGNKVNWTIKEAYKRLGSGQAVINELNDKIRNEGWVVTTSKAQTGHGTYKLYEDLQQTNDPRQTASNFMDWCIGNSTLPLFYQFASHENYYKLIYDYNVYDCVTEEYAPQQAVTNTYPTMVDGQVQPGTVTDGGFDAEYFKGTIEKQMAFMNEYSRNLNEDLDTLAENMEQGKYALFSERDTDYLDAVNRGDMKTAQKMADEAAKRAGFPVKLFHGTAKFGFTKLDVTQSDDGISFFVSDNFDVSASYIPYYEGSEAYDHVREIGKPSKEKGKVLTAKSSVDDLLDFLRKRYPDQYADSHIIKENERAKYIEHYVSDAARYARELLQYSVPKNVEDLANSVIEAETDRSKWNALANSYKEFKGIYEITYNGSYFSQASDVWNSLQERIRLLDLYENGELAIVRGMPMAKENLFHYYEEATQGENVGIYGLYGKEDGQLVIRGRGSNWNNIPLGEIISDFNEWWTNVKGYEPSENGLYTRGNTRNIAEFAKYRGYRSVVFEDIYDTGHYGYQSELSSVYAYFYPQEDIKSADPVTYDDSGNVIPLSERFNKENDDIRFSDRADESNENSPAYTGEYDNGVKFQHREDNPKTLKFLNDQVERGEYTTVYKALLKIGDSYYPPMASLEQDEKGRYTKLRGGQKLYDWIASDGKLTDEMKAKMKMKSPKAWQNKYADALKNGLNPWGMYGDFNLKKSDESGKSQGSVPAAYNPYQHSSDQVLNDQFEAAYDRPGLVVVECRIPNSELTDPYWAPYAKDPTGMHEWKTGPIAGQLKKTTRHVYMTRWIQPVRELPPSEVAERIRDLVSKEDTPPRIYWNAINPKVLQELIKLGVEIDPYGSPVHLNGENALDMYGNPITDEIRAERKAEKESKKSAKKSKKTDVKYSDRVLMGSLFSGGGTLEAGLVYQMLDKEFAVEYNKQIAATYTDNHGKEHMFVGDVRDFNSKDKQNVFYLHASPVCKNFSPASHSGGETTLDIVTAQATARVLEEQMPQAFTVENVKRYIGSEAYKLITDKLTELGYTWDVDVYKASDYGNATKRERMIIRAVKDGDLPAKPAKVSSTTSWGEATRDLWETDLIPSTLVKSKIEAIRNTPELKNLKLTKLDKPLMIYDTTKSKKVTYSWADELAPTLTTKCGDARIIMPDGKVYAPTPKFMGRIQGLPDNYKYPKAKTNAFKIIGNGIPTQLTKAVIGGVLDSAYEQTHDGQVLYQERTEDSVSNRSLLANAFEGVAQTDAERNKIQEYQSKIELIEAEEKKLGDLNAQIKELSFAKGPRDAKKIKKLQIEATQTANRINTYDKQLLRLEASKPLQDVLDREKKKAYKRAEQRGREALAEYKEKVAKTQRELLDRWQDSRKKAIEGRNKTAMRHKIRGVVNELNQYLLKGTKDRHVPESLQKAVAEALNVVNMDTVGADERIAKLEAELLKAKTPEEIQDISRKIDHIREMGDRMNGRLKKLKDAYDELLKSPDENTRNSYDEVIHNKLDSVIDKIGNTPLRDMTLAQLEDVYDMYKMVLKVVRDANKSFKDAKNQSISTRANAVMAQVEEVGGKHTESPTILNGIQKFAWNNLKPVYAFEHIGSVTLTEAFNNVRAGEDTWAKDVLEARAYYLDKTKQYNYDSWDFQKQYTFESTSGMEFKLNLEQIMSLYAYSKRDQAGDHLKYGGIVFDESTKIIKKTKLGISLEFNPTDATAYNISEETLAEITSKLTDEQATFVDEMQDYLSTVMGAKGNEVSMAMYDIKLFKDKNYFPLKSAQQFMEKARDQQKGEVKIKNSGFSKETVPKAKNPIVLTPFMEVWSNHVNEMSMYHAFVLPLEDFYRIYNYKTPSNDENLATEGVNQFIQNAYGRAATAYIDQLLKDLNGGARTDSTTGFINKMMGLFKKGAVFASLSVVVQQPSAIARATALVDTKYFIGPKVDHKRHKELWDEVKQYAPVAIIKEMGYFDTNMGKSTQDYILSKEYGGFSEKMKALVTDSGYRDELLSKAPALADELAWCGIWEAVKREVSAKLPNMDVKSEEFLKLAGERFTEVITKTQVYDSVLSRSGMMRSKDTGMKMATAFMAEPTTSINMIADALLQGKRGRKKYARAAIGAVIASQILNSILVSFVYAGRDDDEDETYLEKYIGTLAGQTLDSLNPATYIPFIKDIVSIVKGYDVERSDMAVVADLWKAWENLSKDNVSAYRKVEGFAGSIAQLFGLPVKNIMRDARGIYKTIESFVNGQQTTLAGIGYAVKGAITGKDVSDRQQLYEAYLSGDATQIARVKSRFKDQSAINTAIRTALRENDPRIKEAAIAWNANNLGEYKRIAMEIIAEKHFAQDDVVMAIRSEANSLKPDAETETTSKAKGLFTAEKFAYAIANGDQASAYAAKADIIATAQANGKSAEDAEKAFVSSAKSELKELFDAGEISEQQAINAIVTFCGKTEDEAMSDVQYWAFKNKYPNVYADDQWFDTYYEKIADSGISIDMYMEYRNAVSTITGDGKKERRMAVIHSLPISKAQKDALYYAEGWTKSKLHEAPWH